VAQVTGAMSALKQIAGPRPFLLAGDSRLISYTNAAAMNAEGAGFVAPLAASRVPAGLFAALPAGAGTAVDYAPARDAGKPATARGSYRVLEDGGMDLRGPRKTGPPVHLRRILVYSTANAEGQAKARARKLATAAEEPAGAGTEVRRPRCGAAGPALGAALHHVPARPGPAYGRGGTRLVRLPFGRACGTQALPGRGQPGVGSDGRLLNGCGGRAGQAGASRNTYCPR
jgi:hypothetical protein